MKFERTPGTVVAHTLAWLYAAALVVPLLYLVVSSLKGNLAIFTSPYSLPSDPQWGNYVEAWTTARLGPALSTSVYVTAASVAVTLLLAVPASYALARSDGRFARVAYATFAAGFLIPPFAALIPTVFLGIELNLYQRAEFLIAFLPATALPLSVILLTAFMRTIPKEMAEAAIMDGAGHWTVLTRLYVPLSMPGIITVVILQSLGFWNEFFYSLVIVGTAPTERTIQVALPIALISENTDFGVLAAGTLISLVPVYLVYVLLQRRMQEALTAGAVKG
ncbi:carbohydrate ABC transporter permease [Jannaschia sp. R86511]|uniref:carbohydrate ABC transporter permease n=1 Tax=Jannaschia sp. R86511 TaxID=3093853 RepID=UPI0036D40F43